MECITDAQDHAQVTKASFTKPILCIFHHSGHSQQPRDVGWHDRNFGHEIGSQTEFSWAWRVHWQMRIDLE